AAATQAERVQIKDAASSRTWTRYSVRYPRPKHLKATHKRLGDTVRLQIAIPHRSDETRLFVGIPIEEPCDLPCYVNAQFEPNVDRRLLREQNKLNQWLIGRLGDLAAAVAIERFRSRPRSAWRSVPLASDGAGSPGWTRAQFDQAVARQRTAVAR